MFIAAIVLSGLAAALFLGSIIPHYIQSRQALAQVPLDYVQLVARELGRDVSEPIYRPFVWMYDGDNDSHVRAWKAKEKSPRLVAKLSADAMMGQLMNVRPFQVGTQTMKSGTLQGRPWTIINGGRRVFRLETIHDP